MMQPLGAEYKLGRRAFLFTLGGVLGCASTRWREEALALPEETGFTFVGIIDGRANTLAETEEEFHRIAKPGDLIVTYMRLGRSVAKRQWLFALLPYGHSMIVLDLEAPLGILECRFHGTRRVGVEELRLYTYSLVYRLHSAERLHTPRLREFAQASGELSKKYNFSSWWGRNDNLRPNTPGEISKQYTCSTMAVAAYHYAGVTLDSRFEGRVVTPLSIAAARGHWNQFALPSPGISAEITPPPLPGDAAP